jgi:hypothetical protein
LLNQILRGPFAKSLRVQIFQYCDCLGRGTSCCNLVISRNKSLTNQLEEVESELWILKIKLSHLDSRWYQACG